MNWVAADHQSAKSAGDEDRRGGRLPLSASWMNPAPVKKIEPTKNVAASQVGPTAAAYQGTTPTAKNTDPIANPQDSRRSLVSRVRGFGTRRS